MRWLSGANLSPLLISCQQWRSSPWKAPILHFSSSNAFMKICTLCDAFSLKSRSIYFLGCIYINIYLKIKISSPHIEYKINSHLGEHRFSTLWALEIRICIYPLNSLFVYHSNQFLIDLDYMFNVVFMFRILIMVRTIQLAKWNKISNQVEY